MIVVEPIYYSNNAYEQKLCTRSNYGVYFNEVRESRSLQQRLLIELKHAGYVSYNQPPESDYSIIPLQVRRSLLISRSQFLLPFISTIFMY